jgi:hypothetical protein
MKSRVTGLALLALLLSTGALAQQGTTEVRGRVLDSQGSVLPGVTVTVRNQDTGMFREAVSADEGTYFISGLVPGVYEITAELQGFKKYARQDVRLEIGKTATVDVPLQVGSVAETVTVTAEAPLVDVTSKEVGGNIGSRELLELPSINRNFIGFIGLLPGIVPSISTESFGSDSITVNGSDPRNNNYLLDGGNNNDDVIGQRAGTQARTAIESVQEFQVITNQFDAQFGRTTGAIINAVTKSGTNQWRGSAFAFAQDAAWTEKDYFAKSRDLPKPDTKRREFGGTFGGPVVRDRMHFFGSLERVMIDRGAANVFPSRPDLNWSPTTQDRVWNSLVRVDHQVTANHTYGVRYLRELSPQRNQAIGQVTPSAGREEDDKDQTAQAHLSSVFGNTKLNTVRAVWTQEDVSFGNPCFNGNGRNQAACPPTLAFQTFTDQQATTAQARVNDAFQLEDTFSLFIPGKRGDHDVKFGIQYEYVKADNFAQDNLNGTFSFGRSDLPFNAADPRTYPDRFSIRVPAQGVVFEKAHYVTGFLQDKWKMGGRLTLSLGLRYDLEVIPIPERDNPRFSSENDYPIDKNNIQPRVGFSYALDSAARSVLRGGYGRFYEKTHFELIGAIFNGGVFSESFTFTTPTTAADPNPRIGLLPTDPFLVNGPTINRALLDQRFPPGSRVRNTGTVSFDSPDRRTPRSDQISLGYEHQLGGTISASADYVHVYGRDQLMLQDLNKGSRATTSATATVVRPDPNFVGVVNLPVNAGKTDYDALLTQVEKRFARSVSMRASYTLSYARGNNSGSGYPASNFQVGQDLNLDLNEGPTDFNRRHNFVVSGRTLVPFTHGMTFSWVARALSGLPFTLVNNDVDADRNGTLFDPIAPATYSGTAARDNYTVKDYNGRRNGAVGPGFFQLDARFGYRFNLRDRRTLDVSADVFNLTNRANFANPGSNTASPATFLVISALRDGAPPRTAQVGVRFGF